MNINARILAGWLMPPETIVLVKSGRFARVAVPAAVRHGPYFLGSLKVMLPLIHFSRGGELRCPSLQAKVHAFSRPPSFIFIKHEIANFDFRTVLSEPGLKHFGWCCLKHE